MPCPALRTPHIHAYFTAAAAAAAVCARAQALEADLSALEEDTASLEGKLEELRGLLGEQKLQEGGMVALATEAGHVRMCMHMCCVHTCV